MKVSLNTVKQYTNIDLTVDELVQKVNSQLGGVEEVIDLTTKYKDAVIVKIVTAEQHPNADRLKVTKIDDGGVAADVPRDDNGYVQVVCGAPNARADIYAVWLPPSATVPASFDDPTPFVLDARELRGVLSQGMLAAPDELAIGSEHDGILEIDAAEWSPKQDEIKPGASFAHVFGLDDTVLDIENKMFTHRPDCFGALGVAREIAGIQQQPFSSPDWYMREPVFRSGDGLELTVTNDAIEKVPRFMTVAIKEVTVKPSPLWLQCELVRLGAKPINNIVDVTNYVMLLTAQPTHAYDYDKLRGHTLGVRLANKGETITLLNHKSYELDDNDIVIVDGDGPVGLAGIMGGSDSEVSSDTNNIVLECANFDMYTLRKSSMRHGVFTDALTRFNKGQSPLQNSFVLDLLIASVFDVAGGVPASQVFDQSAELKPHRSVEVGIGFINDRLGTNLSADQVAELMTNVEFIVAVKGDELTVTPGFWRTDIEIAEDIVEEVGRLYGFDRLPRELPHRSIAPAVQNRSIVTKMRLRRELAKLGGNELLNYSFVHENILRRSGQDPSEAFRLSNALSPDLQYYRLSLTPSLLAQVHANIKAGHDEFLLFEIGKAHGKSELDDYGLPRELGRVSGVYAANSKAARQYSGAAFFAIKRYVDELCRGRDLTYLPLQDAGYKDKVLFRQMIAPYDPERSAVVFEGNALIGVLGEFRPTNGFKLPEYAAGFELFLSAFEADSTVSYKELSRFPSMSQDISLRVGSETSYATLEEAIAGAVSHYAKTEYDITHKPTSIYRPDDGTDTTYTFRIKVTHHGRTLTELDASDIVGAIAKAAQQVGAMQV